jgi:hypothetical protein
MTYTTYTLRGETQLEVTAELYADGAYQIVDDNWIEPTFDPVFQYIKCFDDNGDQVELTAEELKEVTENFVSHYWETV